MNSHWCHYFASPPTEVFTSRHWRRFSELAGVDLRSLPYSYLVLDKRPWNEIENESVSNQTVRILGHPRVYKAFALLLGCGESGLIEGRLTKSHLPEAFKLARKERLPAVLQWKLDGNEISALPDISSADD